MMSCVGCNGFREYCRQYVITDFTKRATINKVRRRVVEENCAITLPKWLERCGLFGFESAITYSIVNTCV